MGDDMKKAIIGCLVAIAIPVCVVFDSAVALMRGWTPPDFRDRPATGLLPVFLVFGFTFLATALLFFARCRRIYASKIFKFALANSSIMLVLLAFENLSANVIDRWAFLHRRPNSLHKVFRPEDDVMPGASPEAHYRTNSLGIRGPEFPTTRSDYRILCVGGRRTMREPGRPQDLASPVDGPSQQRRSKM